MIILVNTAEMETHLRAKALPAIAAVLRLVTDRLVQHARMLDEE